MKPERSIKQSKVSTQARQHTIPASKKAQQMQRTGMRERACGSRTDQNPLAEHAHTHTHKHHHRARTQPGHTIIPASCRNPASRHSRCSAQARASGLAGAERAKTHSRSTRNTPRNLAASRGEAAERRRRGGDERRRTLFCERASGWKRSSNESSDVVFFYL